MKIITSCFLLLLLPTIAFAQKIIPDFGEIDRASLEMKDCEFEKGAGAVKLFDIQDIVFDDDGYTAKLTTEKRVRIKIFNEQGYKFASVKIPYYNRKRSAKIKDLQAIIYNLDSAGKIVTYKLTKKDFFKDKLEENVDVINFTFPQLKAGSVIEFSYRKVEKNTIDIDSWYIQDEMPVNFASTLLRLPEYYQVSQKVFGADTISMESEIYRRGSYNWKRIFYKAYQIPSFRAEPLMTSRKDNLMRMIFLVRSGTFFGSNPETVWGVKGSDMLNNPLLKNQLKDIIKGTQPLLDSANAIKKVTERIEFLVEKIKNRFNEGNEQTKNFGSLQEAWESKIATTAEINLILLNLMRNTGIDCHPLLVSTRDNGKAVIDFPSFSQFNGLDAMVYDSLDVYIIDANLKYQSPLLPPLNILNRKAFLLEKDNLRWVTVIDNRPLLRQAMSVQGTVNKDGEMNGSAFITYANYAKSLMLDTTNIDEDDKFIDKKAIGLEIDSSRLNNTATDTKPLEQTIYFTYTIPSSGDYFFINPELFSSTKANPFKAATRNSEIDFGCKQSITLRFFMELPENMTIDFLPKNITVRAPDSSFMYSRISAAENSRIVFTQKFEIAVPVFDKTDYPSLKEFFDKVYSLMKEEIVLKKKKN